MAGERTPVTPAQVWPAILSGTMAGATTERLFDEYINPAIADLNRLNPAANYGLTFEGVQQINALRSNAASIREASNQLMAAPPSYAITSDVISQPWYQRAQYERESERKFHAIVETTAISAGGPQTRTVTIEMYPEDLPQTIGGLLDVLNVFAGARLSHYNEELSSVDRVLLTEV